MDTKMKSALESLRDSHSAVEAAFLAFEEMDLSKENAKLRENLERLDGELQRSRDETSAVKEKHEKLTRDFKHELSSKRNVMLGLNGRRHQEYLYAGLEREREQINTAYKYSQKMMDTMSAQLKTLDDEERGPLQNELNSLRGRIAGQANQALARRESAWRKASGHYDDVSGEIMVSPVEDAALGAVRKFFAWEAFLGLKIISAIGALLLLLGVFTFGRYLYVNLMGPELQCAAIFALGILLMGAGEVFYQKKWRGGFALALTASGSGILFLGAGLGYMTLSVLPMWAALAICASASALSFAAALRYKEQLVAISALIGGYLPLIALEESLILFGAVYFSVLSLFALLIATGKDWRVTRFIGLFAGLIAGQALVNYMSWPNGWSGANAAVGGFIAIGFVTFLVIPVFGAWVTKARIRVSDIVLLSCNLFFSFLLAMSWLNRTSLVDMTIRFNAFAAAFFTVSCVVMALITERQRHSGMPESETGSLRALFFITGVTFTALTVLFALDSAWFSIGWLVQAAGLSMYGIFKNRRRFNIAGLVIGICCLLSFLFVNVPDYGSGRLFVWQYLSITLAALLVSVAALKAKAESGAVRVLLDIFRGAAAFNLWGFVVYALHWPFWSWYNKLFNLCADNIAALGSIAFGFILAFALPRIKRVPGYGFRVAAIALGTVNAGWLLIFNANLNRLPDIPNLKIVVSVLFIVVNIVAVCWLNDLLRFMSKRRELPLGWYPLLVSGFAVLLASQNLVVQLNLTASSLILTLLFGLTALGWVVLGFAKRNSAARIGGLAMAFFAVIKLFVLDLHDLNTTGRIISYFSGGIVLLAISFIYQWFNKKLNRPQ
jgi:uncharacterized membrane protein